MVKIRMFISFIRRIWKFGHFIPFSNLLLTYDIFKLSEDKKQLISNRRNKLIQNILTPFAEEALMRYKPTSDVKGAEFIWVCWLQGEDNMPLLVKNCVYSIRKNANGHQVILVDQDNYDRYVKMPVRIVELYKSGKIKAAHFADMLRINLLAQQGGLWLDATIFMAAPIPEEWWRFDFYSIKTLNEGHFVSKCRWAVFALAAKQNCKLFRLLADAFNCYFEKHGIFVDYFMFDNFVDLFYQKDEEIKRLIDDVLFNNPNVHKLENLIVKPFDKEEYSKLTRNTYLFKLSTRTHNSDELLQDTNSFFNQVVCCEL